MESVLKPEAGRIGRACIMGMSNVVQAESAAGIGIELLRVAKGCTQHWATDVRRKLNYS